MSDVHISQHIETHNTLPFVINVNCFLFKMLQTEVVYEAYQRQQTTQSY